MKIVLPHTSVNLVYSTDQHLSAIPIGRRADNYQKAILDKLKFQGELAKKIHGVCISGGDMFHHKNPKAKGNTMGLVEATTKVLCKFPLGKMFVTVGNHDIQFDQMSSLPNQPLGVLIASGVCHNLVVEPVVFTNQDESISVLVDTYAYCDEKDLLPQLLASGPKPDGVTYRVGLLHAYGHPDPENAEFGSSGIGYNPIGYEQLSELDYDFLCWGHDHSYKETVTVGNVTHLNFGSLARAAFNTDELDRVVSLGVMSFSVGGARYLEKPVPVKPLEVVFTTADKPMTKIGKSEDVRDVFADMEEAVDSLESNDPREVLKQLCPVEESEVLAAALELCEF